MRPSSEAERPAASGVLCDALRVSQTEGVMEEQSSAPADDPVRSEAAQGPSASKGRAPTIYDVARRAGVAPSTVSRAFARPGRVSFETAERIRSAADELGYRARTITRRTDAREGTRMIALVLSDISNPVYFDLLRGAEEAAADADYTIVLANSQETVKKEQEALGRVLPLVDGVLMVSSRMSDSAVRMTAKQKPTIMLNRAVSGVVSVVTDNAMGTRRAVEHLVSQNIRDITYVAGPEASWTDGMRWRAVRETGAALHARIHRLGPVAPTIAGGRAAALSWMEHRTSGVICYNDLMAVGFVRTLQEHGLSVPRDAAVIGYDNIMLLPYVSPSMSTIAAPVHAIGTTATKNLVAMIRGAQPTSSRPLVLPSKLVVRQSSRVLETPTLRRR